MTKSHDRLPMGSPLIPKRVITSRFASRSRAFPLCRRLEDTGYFTSPPRSICKASIAQHFNLSRESVESCASPQVRVRRWSSECSRREEVKEQPVQDDPGLEDSEWTSY